MLVSPIAFATCSELPQLTEDDRLLIPALSQRGLVVVPAVWDDTTVDWNTFEAVVLRSTWDYHRRLPEFMQWTQCREAQLVNKAEVVRWNSHKGYLAELEREGVKIVPTTFSKAGSVPEIGWDRAVVKPAVSATAHNTWVYEGGLAADQKLAQQALSEDLLVQPFLSQIQSEGELSLIYIGGEYSHAVLKKAQTGDFRVQDQFGGTSQLADAPSAALESAELLASIKPELTYARVDGVMVDGAFLLMEWELIEPSLFLGEFPPSVEAFASALVQEIERRSYREAAPLP